MSLFLYIHITDTSYMVNSTELIAKRNSIFDAFTKAKDEFVTLNAEVEAFINIKMLSKILG